MADSQAQFQEALSLEGEGRGEEAGQIYRRLFDADPGFGPAADRLAGLALERGDFNEALPWAEKAVALLGAFAPARVNLALAHLAAGKLEAAVEAAETAARDGPNFAPAQFVLGEVLWEKGDYDHASAAFEKAIQLAPEAALDFENLQFLRQEDADWRGYETAVRLTTKLTASGALLMNPIKFMHLSDQASEHQQNARLLARRYPVRPPLWSRHPRSPGKIRLGYLSSDFYDHAVAHLAVGYLESHDRDRFEVTAFSCCPPYPSAIRDRIVAAFDRFENLVDFDDLAIARLICEREIDVLVYLSGHTYRARPGVLSNRPAPVQVNFQGYPGTLGAPWCDYLIADKVVIPEDQFGFYDEKVVWMPHTYQPTDDRVPREDGSRTRAEEGLAEDAFVLMAYHPASKITPPTFDAWMGILTRVPKAVLWLQEVSEIATRNLRSEAAARGVDPARLIFSQRLTARADHMARHRLADVFVDALPYNAHSTASDALWMGLPVATCPGGAFPGRVAAGLVAAAGFPELAAPSPAALENLVVDLAENPDRLAALKARVAAEAPSSPLFDTAAFTRHLEAAYQTMYERTQTGLRPESFAVEIA